MAQGVIPRHDVAAGASGMSRINDRKRTREDEVPGPSKRHTGPTIKEEIPTLTRAQRIQDLQVSEASTSFSISRA
jgi:hypothetical protein